MAFLDSVFGSKPQIADYKPVDLSAEQIKALEGDIAAWPEIAQLGDLTQQYLLNQYETAIPGFRDILKLGGETTTQMLDTAQQELTGAIPADVQASLERSTAFQSLMSGTEGSGMAKALTARDFGLTSLDLINQGAGLQAQAGNAAQRWAALSGAQVPQGMLITPMEQANLDVQQNLIKRNIKQQKFNVAAAPDPALQALNQWVEQIGGTVIGSYLGAKPGANYKTSYSPTSYGATDVTNPGFYASDPNATGGAPFTSPTFDTTPMQSNIAPNPFTDTSGLSLGPAATGSSAGLGSTGYMGSPWDQYGGTNFPAASTATTWGG